MEIYFNKYKKPRSSTFRTNVRMDGDARVERENEKNNRIDSSWKGSGDRCHRLSVFSPRGLIYKDLRTANFRPFT